MPAQSDRFAQANIDTVARMESELHRQRTASERLADAIGGFVGSFWFVVVHAAFFAGWFLWNSGVVPGLEPFDPYPFIFLTMAVSAEGVILATFVLMKQNRMSRRADVREHLHLQINLLAEKEITKVLQMLERISKQLGVESSVVDEESRELSQHTAVEDLLADLKRKIPMD